MLLRLLPIWLLAMYPVRLVPQRWVVVAMHPVRATVRRIARVGGRRCGGWGRAVQLLHQVLIKRTKHCRLRGALAAVLGLVVPVVARAALRHVNGPAAGRQRRPAPVGWRRRRRCRPVINVAVLLAHDTWGLHSAGRLVLLPEQAGAIARRVLAAPRRFATGGLPLLAQRGPRRFSAVAALLLLLRCWPRGWRRGHGPLLPNAVAPLLRLLLAQVSLHLPQLRLKRSTLRVVIVILLVGRRCHWGIPQRRARPKHSRARLVIVCVAACAVPWPLVALRRPLIAVRPAIIAAVVIATVRPLIRVAIVATARAPRRGRGLVIGRATAALATACVAVIRPATPRVLIVVIKVARPWAVRIIPALSTSPAVPPSPLVAVPSLVPFGIVVPIAASRSAFIISPAVVLRVRLLMLRPLLWLRAAARCRCRSKARIFIRVQMPVDRERRATA